VVQITLIYRILKDTFDAIVVAWQCRWGNLRCVWCCVTLARNTQQPF